MQNYDSSVETPCGFRRASIASESRKLAGSFLGGKKKSPEHTYMIFCSVDKHIANAQGENLCGEITAETILSNRVLHLLK